MTKKEKKALLSAMIKALKLQKKCILVNSDYGNLNKEQRAFVESGIDIGFTCAIETLKYERDAVSGIADCE